MVDTFHSTDAGVAYFVTCGGRKRFIMRGDLHDWVFDSASERENRQMTGMYRHEIDKMKNISLDVAFCSTGSKAGKTLCGWNIIFSSKGKKQSRCIQCTFGAIVPLSINFLQNIQSMQM